MSTGDQHIHADQNASSPQPVGGDTSDAREQFPIVGIGASAGGLQAFEEFFTRMPTDSQMAFVIVQHLAPDHESILAEILSRYTTMPVHQVRNGMLVKPDTVYVIPPRHDMALMQGKLHLIEPTHTRGLRLPIDFFFRSLADELHERAISIILSGTGTDGTLGMRAIKGAGGMVMVQEPTSARYDGMLRSAIDTDLVDYILPADQMPAQLLKYARHDFLTGARQTSPMLSQANDLLQKIYILLRNQTGHDFSLYKKSTILRRIERRMAINQITWLSDYIRYLQRNAQEVHTLFRELFIGVTSFFRDTEAFEALEQKVIPRLLQGRTPNQPIRVWVPACSTGEEAFSLAILLCEQREARRLDVPIQIFATDIDSQAIERARTGSYPDSIAVDVSPERLERFFHPLDSAYRVNKEVRDMVIFAEQSVIKDPPFSDIDLISCRNLLIYLEMDLQQKVLALFHRALKSEAFLFLGSSETPGLLKSLFRDIDGKWQIYQRVPSETAPPVGLDFSLPTIPQMEAHKPAADTDAQRNLRQIIEQTLLNHFAPSAVLVNERGDILYIHGKTGRYWETSTGKAEWNIFRMAREDLQITLTVNIRHAITRQQDVLHKQARLTEGDMVDIIYVSIRLVPHSRLLVVIFEEQLPSEALPLPEPELEPGDEQAAYVRRLQQELKAAQEYLAATSEELQASNEELRSSNEELQSSNEQLRSSNEQLSTSKQELQSVNEELVTVNAELQNKIAELSRANNYLRNLLANIEVGLIFLDMQLRISWYTPTATSVVHVIDSDIGRPLSDLVPNIDYAGVLEDAQAVLDTLESKAQEVRIRDTDEWYWMRITPYRTTENIIEGVVLSFSNISENKRQEAALRQQQQFLSSIYSGIEVPIFVIDRDDDGRFLYEGINPACERITGYTLQQVQHRYLDDLGDVLNASSIAHLQQLFATVVSTGEPLEYEQMASTPSEKLQAWWLTRLQPLKNQQGQVYRIVATVRHITRLKRVEARLQQREHLLQALAGWWAAVARGAVDSTQMLQAACRLLVEVAEYQAVWVGVADESKLRYSAAHAMGINQHAVAAVSSWLTEEAALHLLPMLRQAGKPLLITDMHDSTLDEVWRLAELRYGYTSAVVLPFTLGATPPLVGGIVAWLPASASASQQDIDLLQSLVHHLTEAYTILQQPSGTSTRA